MGAAAGDPGRDLTLDPGGSDQPPDASFTLTPQPGRVQHRPSPSTARLERPRRRHRQIRVGPRRQRQLRDRLRLELEHDAANTPPTRRSTVRLRVTDNKGATDVSVRTLTVIGNQFPTASFTATPNPAIQGLTVSFNALRLERPRRHDRQIRVGPRRQRQLRDQHRHDPDHLDLLRQRRHGPGRPAGHRQRRQNRDQNGAGLDQHRRRQQLPRRGQRHPGLIHYWRLGETSGTTFADSVGTSNATAFGGPTLGVAGGDRRRPRQSRALRRRRRRRPRPRRPLRAEHDHGRVLALHRRLHQRRRARPWSSPTTSTRTKAASSSTRTRPRPAANSASAIGNPDTRNNAFFARPSTGQWHHYAFVLDTAAPAAQQITPYVDGKAVAYTKTAEGTGSGAFANSTLNFMSRAGQQLFGRGALDDLAIYGRALTAAEISEHQPASAPTAARSPPSPRPPRRS